MDSVNQNIPLLEPIQLGGKTLRNRIVMAPLTRRRATDDHVPTGLMETYYAQRASAGLIVAEATNISPQAVGYMNSPGIYTAEQVRAWKKITGIVHERGGTIYLQLWHVGRVSHPLLQPGNQLPVSASDIAAGGMITTPGGRREMVAPKALLISEIKDVTNDYINACLNAVEAGFDGIEIHGANGYLPDQFLHNGSNRRTDRYGGSIGNRCRFLLEVTDGCCAAIGSERVGVRLSPSGTNKDMYDDNVVPVYEYLIDRLNGYDLAYLHITEPNAPLLPEEKYRHYIKKVTPYFRKFYRGILITNLGYDYDSGNRVLSEGHADMVAYGKLYISNPDLVERFRKGAPLRDWDKTTFYHGGEQGYTDYPEYGSGSV